MCRKDRHLSTARGQENTMTKRLALLSLTVLPAFALLANGSVAQETGSPRFQMEKTESGFVRLDRETGAISVCREDAGELICRMRSEEHTSELQSLMRNSYAVFC